MILKILCAVLFFLVWIGLLSVAFDEIKMRRSCKYKIQGKFVRIQQHSAGRHKSFNPVFMFEYNGRKYNSIESQGDVTYLEKRDFKKNGKVKTYTLWINPVNPYQCYHRGLFHIVTICYHAWLILFAFGMPLMIIELIKSMF